MAALLDASAVLVVLLGEPGADRVAPSLADGQISAVNASEVIAKLIDAGQPAEMAEALLQGLMLPVRDFGGAAARAAGRLRQDTRRLGLSLGDRACLAEAAVTGLPVLTADRAWAGLDIGVEVEVIR